MAERQHIDDALIIIDNIEQPIVADPVSPCRRIIAAQFFDVGAEVGTLFQLGVGVVREFSEKEKNPTSFTLHRGG
jgi:hypothetical protein